MDMIRSRHVACNGLPGAGVIAAFVVSVLLSASRAYAQAGGDPVTTQVGYVNLHSSGTLFGVARGSEIATAPWREQQTAPEPTSGPSWNIRRSLATLDQGTGVLSNRKSVPAFQASSGSRQRSAGRKVVGGVIGAVGGFFGGGFLGAAIEGDRCNCDDPGFVGFFFIGGPIGAVIGGIVGVKFF
jgi:hypothetical protein